MTFAAVSGGVRKGTGSGEGGGWKETAVNFATLLSLFLSIFLSLQLYGHFRRTFIPLPAKSQRHTKSPAIKVAAIEFCVYFSVVRSCRDCCCRDSSHGGLIPREDLAEIP